MRSGKKLFVLAPLMLATACVQLLGYGDPVELGSATDAQGPAADAGSETDAPPASGDGRADATNGPCNDVPILDGNIQIYAAGGTPPTPKGGVIANGTWVLADSRGWGTTIVDGGKIDGFGSSTFEIDGTTVQVATKDTNSDVVQRQTLILQTNDTTYDVTTTCLSSPTKYAFVLVPGSYTATPSTLSFYVTEGTKVFEFNFSKHF